MLPASSAPDVGYTEGIRALSVAHKLRLFTCLHSHMTCTIAADAQARMTAYEQWYDSKDADTQALIDEIHDTTSYIIDEDEYDAFISMLDNEMGITSASQFCDAFAGEWEGVGDHVTTKFTEELIDDCYSDDIASMPSFLQNAIDYELVWYQSMRYDYYDLEFKGNTYFFNRNY